MRFHYVIIFTFWGAVTSASTLCTATLVSGAKKTEPITFVGNGQNENAAKIEALYKCGGRLLVEIPGQGINTAFAICMSGQWTVECTESADEEN